MATVTSLSAGTVAVALSICPEKTMPYATGETPLAYVKNEFGQPGTVTRLRMASNEDDFVSIRWDDGGLDSPLTPAKEFTLISRRA